MKSILLYLLLVGFPVLALVSVVRVGERIVPPPYVGGTWRVTEEAGVLPEKPCVPLVPGAEPIEVEITQSGTVLEMVFRGMPPVRAGARLRGDTLRASRLRGAPACAAGWVLEARILGLDARARMVGQWAPVGCDTCAARRFTATRVTGPETKGR